MVRYFLFVFSYFFLISGLQAAAVKCGGIYEVKTGDTLGVIASRIYGRSSQYSLIYSANRSALSKGPSSIRVGQKLKIPCKKGDVVAEAGENPSAALFDTARNRNARLDQVASLIQQGADVNFRTPYWETPMHAAASVGRLDVLRYLRSRGALHNVPTSNRWLPLHHAVRFGHVQTAQYLIRIGTPLYARTTDNKSVFDIAYALRNDAMINMLNHYR